MKELLTNVGSGGSGGGPAAGGGGAAGGDAAEEAAEEKKEEERMWVPYHSSWPPRSLKCAIYRFMMALLKDVPNSRGGVRRGYGLWSLRLNKIKFLPQQNPLLHHVF